MPASLSFVKSLSEFSLLMLHEITKLDDSGAEVRSVFYLWPELGKKKAGGQELT